MLKPNWQLITKVRVPANPQGLWTLAWDYVTGPKKLKLEVNTAEVPPQTWSYSVEPPRRCTAEGDPYIELATDKHLLPGARVGALIGKIGGSTAGRDDALKFPVGTLCIKDLKEDEKGPLFLTINDEITGMTDNRGGLEVSIYEAL